jgi:HPt (histidine-containing phosphotransfer) domain-containing protein
MVEYQVGDGVPVKLALTDTILAPEIFDRLRQATAGDPAVLAELCRDYLAEGRSTLLQLRVALAAGNALQVRERAHYLKGSSLMIGANALSQCCATLERMGRDADLSGAAPVVEEAAAALAALETELTKQLGPAALPADGSAA